MTTQTPPPPTDYQSPPETTVAQPRPFRSHPIWFSLQLLIFVGWITFLFLIWYSTRGQ